MKSAGIISLLVAAATADPLQTTVGQDLCCAINTLRAANNAPALLWSPDLDAVAQGHSDYMQAHTLLTNVQDPDTPTYDLYGRLDTAKYAYDNATQQVSTGFSTPNKSVGAWGMSQASKHNLINPLFTVCGGAVANPGAYYTSVLVLPQGNPTVYPLICSDSEVSAGSKESSDGEASVETP
ncbi:hypothetical protein IW148_003851 [Coemansia sp. RSA 1199]|nr:hypothetical protein IW148_003851 [Coemansia sp. RSA 1199]